MLYKFLIEKRKDYFYLTPIIAFTKWKNRMYNGIGIIFAWFIWEITFKFVSRRKHIIIDRVTGKIQK